VTRLRTFLSRLWALVRSRQRDRDIDDEMASHLAEATDEYIEQGLSPEDAHWAALRSFGGVTQTKELYRQARAFMWLDDLRQDLRHTARTLVKNPVFTLIVILTLALGIGANTTIFTLLDAVIFKPLPVPAPTKLVTLYEKGPEGNADIAGGTGQYLRFSHPRFERLEQALGTKGSLAGHARNFRVLEDRDVKLRGFLGLVIEPQTRHNPLRNRHQFLLSVGFRLSERMMKRYHHGGHGGKILLVSGLNLRVLRG
jgi:hypothetical protein